MDWPKRPTLGDAGWMGVISPNSLNSLGPALAGSWSNSATWPVANTALFVPFRVDESITIDRLMCGTGSGTTGNFDLGIYDANGTLIVSTGSTAKTTATASRIINVTDTEILPGLYYMAMVTDGVTAYVGFAMPAAGICKMLGMRQMASAFPLPSTATLATCTQTHVPLVGAVVRG